MGVPVSTVRGWLRRFAANAEAVRVWFTVLAHDLDPMLAPVAPTGTAFGDAVEAIGVAARAAALRLAPVDAVAVRVGGQRRPAALQHELALGGRRLSGQGPGASSLEVPGGPMDDRHRDVALFRYSLIREAADPALTKAERGRLVRALAARDHAGPGGERVRVARNTLDRWIRTWRAGRLRGAGARGPDGGADHAGGACWTWR